MPKLTVRDLFAVAPLMAWAYPAADYTDEWIVLTLAVIGLAWGVSLFFRRTSLAEMLAFVAYWTLPAMVIGRAVMEAMRHPVMAI